MSRRINFRHKRNKSGFGLVELLVSISIIVLVTSVVLARHSSYNGAILLRSQAYDIALQIRETQLSAVSAVGDGSANFRQLFGVYLDVANDDEYKIFTDDDSSNTFDPNEEFGLQGFLDNRFEIRAIREIGATVTDRSEVSIIFERPNFDARFFDGSGNPLSGSSVEIEISRRGNTGTGVGDVRVIEVTSTGQIAVL